MTDDAHRPEDHEIPAETPDETPTDMPGAQAGAASPSDGPPSDGPAPDGPPQGPRVVETRVDLCAHLGIWADTTDSILAASNLADRPWSSVPMQRRIQRYGAPNLLVWSSAILAGRVARAAYHDDDRVREVIEAEARKVEIRLLRMAHDRDPAPGR